MPAAHNLPTTFGKYKIQRVFGEGSTCVVAEAFDKQTGESYAVKIINLKDKHCSRLSSAVEREIRLLKTFDHPNIIKLIEVVHENGIVFVVMEYCEGGTLLDFILSDKLKSLSEVKRLFHQITKAISYLHNLGIAHGDIKPDNIVLTSDGNAKLIDFGYCKESLLGFDDDKSGTVKYAPPEFLRSGAYNTRKADIWSLGILLFVMATGRFPYGSSDDSVVRRLVLSGRLAHPEQIGSELKELYEVLTRLAPRQRPTADSIVKSPFLTVSKRKDEKKQQNTTSFMIVKTASENEMDELNPF
jgi:MAP/microtubule affinity-regulating kinase